MELVRIGYVDDPNLAEVYAASMRSEGIEVVLSGGATIGYPTRIGFGGRTYLAVAAESEADAIDLLTDSDLVFTNSSDVPVAGDWLLIGGIALVLVFILVVQALR
ncbi:MAG: hypothetical protein KJO36_02580 [Acidimicrobiia bacterium]|nr:hypothetical protein [Acidimicrobiia bacterium]NNL48670.1 hypothetical protein [Acidimicrobiia bacterium]